MKKYCKRYLPVVLALIVAVVPLLCFPAAADETSAAQSYYQPYVNQVLSSIDTDGSLYNGLGYITGYRLNSSGSEAAMDGAVVSGFVPYDGELIRVYGSLNSSASYSGHYVALYDSSFNLIYTIGGSNYESYGIAYEEYEGKYLVTLDPAAVSNASVKEYLSAAAYIRASMPDCAGDAFIVTLDEEILFETASALFSVFGAVIDWIGSSFPKLITVFYVEDTGLTILGELAVVGLGLSFALLLLAVVRNPLRRW